MPKEKVTVEKRIEAAKACAEGRMSQGEVGLEDRRGKRVSAQEPRTELEKAQIEIAQLKHELYMTRMERDLLKKPDKLERRDAFRK